MFETMKHASILALNTSFAFLLGRRHDHHDLRNVDETDLRGQMALDGTRTQWDEHDDECYAGVNRGTYLLAHHQNLADLSLLPRSAHSPFLGPRTPPTAGVQIPGSENHQLDLTLHGLLVLIPCKPLRRLLGLTWRPGDTLPCASHLGHCEKKTRMLLQQRSEKWMETRQQRAVSHPCLYHACLVLIPNVSEHDEQVSLNARSEADHLVSF